MHRGDLRLRTQTLAQAVAARLGQQQRLVPGNVLETGQIPAQGCLLVQIHVEGAEVEAVDLEKFGGRVVHVSEEACRRCGLDVPVQLAQEPLDVVLPVPPDDAARNLVADGKQQQRRVRGQAPHVTGGVPPNPPCGSLVIEKRDVVRPTQPHHDVETMSCRSVEQPNGWRCVGAQRVDTGGRHLGEVRFDLRGCGELQAAGVWRERAVGGALDQKAPTVDVEELSVDRDAARGAAFGRRRTKPHEPNLIRVPAGRRCWPAARDVHDGLLPGHTTDSGRGGLACRGRPCDTGCATRRLERVTS